METPEPLPLPAEKRRKVVQKEDDPSEKRHLEELSLDPNVSWSCSLLETILKMIRNHERVLGFLYI